MARRTASSDYEAVKEGYVSVTPLQPDMTAHTAMDFLEGLPLPEQVRQAR